MIRAFNANLPYDRFLVWQLAGDMLDQPTPDQRLATAFNRLTARRTKVEASKKSFALNTSPIGSARWDRPCSD